MKHVVRIELERHNDPAALDAWGERQVPEGWEAAGESGDADCVVRWAVPGADWRDALRAVESDLAAAGLVAERIDVVGVWLGDRDRPEDLANHATTNELLMLAGLRKEPRGQQHTVYRGDEPLFTGRAPDTHAWLVATWHQRCGWAS